MTYRRIALLRLLFQLFFLVFIAAVAVRGRLGQSFDTCESICPFGGAEGMIYFLTHRQYLCVLSYYNVALFIALLLLALAAGRLFCSYLCPLGLLYEKMNALRLRWKIKAKLPPPGVDRALQALRYLVIAVILYATWKIGDLVFRGYDPFFALFSLHGHGIAWTSYLVLGLTVAGALFIPMAWCRYLCPLGGAMDLPALVKLIRVTRDRGSCTGCGACDRTCPMAIPVSRRDEVREVNCTLCLQCASHCPEKDALQVRGPVKRPAAWVLPVLVLAFLVLSHLIAPLFRVPTLKSTFKPARPAAAPLKETVFTVEGLTCRGKSLMLSENLRYLPGMYEMETYASERKLIVRYDPGLLGEQDIRECIEGTMRDPETGEEAAPFRVLRAR
ncbi:MAG: 4Fe-4S binding protein [Candidatus Eremiobacteraeota bacterium]|nr:4Fe-4S binding protein [Candidatus Eremiobacteraeota bacterium]